MMGPSPRTRPTRRPSSWPRTSPRKPHNSSGRAPFAKGPGPNHEALQGEEYMSTSTTVTPGLTFRPRATLNTTDPGQPFVVIELDGDPSRVAYFIYTTEEADAYIKA